MMSGTGDAKKGFTLLELLVVMALMVILAGMAFTKMKGTIVDFEFQSVAEQFHSVLDRLHDRAMWERKMITLAIDSRNNEYRHYTSDTENSARPTRMPNDIKIESDKDEIQFYPDGSIDVANIALTGTRERAAVFSTQGVFGGIKTQFR